MAEGEGPMKNLSSKFTRFSLGIQLNIANKVGSALRIQKVYVFDTTGTFLGSEIHMVQNYRYNKTKDGKVAVLSGAAQRVIPHAANYYTQLSPDPTRLVKDSIGLYIIPDADYEFDLDSILTAP